MNKIERFVHNLIKANPQFKDFIRDTYQSLLDLVPVANKVAAYDIKVREGYFFGFHDKTPFSFENKYLLANKYHIPLRMPEKSDSLTLGVFEGNEFERFRPLTKTLAWNWHQGCMLQWCGNEQKFIYNDVESNKLLSRIYDIDSNNITDIPEPIGAVSPDGKHAVGYNFTRVEQHMPGYGYNQGTDPTASHKAPDTNGLYHINLETGNIHELFSIRDIVGIDHNPTMDGKYHYFSHCLFSPSNKRFVFMHRWVAEHKRKRWSRLISCNLDGSGLFIFPAQEMVSHIGWKDEEHIIAYSHVPNKGDHYFLFKDRDPSFYKIIGKNILNSDGHPSYSPNKEWIITDTYPNGMRRQLLILFDTINNTRYDIAKLKHPAKFTSKKIEEHWTCDLHPRWDRNNEYICFDSVFTGKRALCTINLEGWKRNNIKAISTIPE
jgi:hypothetical protein